MYVKGSNTPPQRAETRRAKMSHDQIMQDNIATMSRDQITEAINTLTSVYIPNIVATFQHPLVLASYTDRLTALKAVLA